jgi:signal transduction histidine kinase
MQPNRLLNKHITKHLSPDHLNDPAIQQFIAAVAQGYQMYEKEKQLTDHAYEINEREYQLVLDNLRKENVIRQQSIEEIIKALVSLGGEDSVTDSNVDIIEIIRSLQTKITETKQLKNDLKSAKDVAEQALRVKTDFLTTMSHEIRTPLNAIIGIIHLLKDEELKESQEKTVTALDLSANNLLLLINDILDFAKIDEGRIEFQNKAVEFKSLMKNVITINSFRANEKNNILTLDYDENLPFALFTDPVRLAQILNNLLSNAIKFTSNGNVVLKVYQVAAANNQYTIRFSISDTGIGIAPENLQKIFDRFTQADAGITQNFGGSGLGLAICKKL